LAETRLDQLGETGSIASLASIAGSMEDAQGRFNLHNLVNNGQIVDKELEAFRRLASLLELPTQTADLIAERMLESQGMPSSSDEKSGDTSGEAEGVPPLPLMLPRDIIGVPGVSPEAADRLAPYIVVLDERTAVNVNTASAEVIAARVPDLTLGEARALVAERERISYFNSIGEVRTRLGAKGSVIGDAELSTNSRFFFIRGEVKLDRAVTRMEALVKRGAPGQGPAAVTVLWTREI
ncbi:MAG TPA: type II secretion system minor pseudopilin GspK, partial [Burkholderiaceae bacterium]|nr:type II secretion system minor pseudopilin GspK [Burkholderiaceae bacterium]